MASTDLLLPSGFRFHPTDEELVIHYLCMKCVGLPISIPIISELDLYKYNPWQLPGMALYGDKEWYFFSPRDRKYPNGSRPNRAAGAGYWKAAGADKAIRVPITVAIKKALVFYDGKAPGGEKTNWIMHEYRLAGVDPSHLKEQSRRLDGWVLCRIYHKKGASNTPGNPDRKPSVRSFQSPPSSVAIPPNPELPISLAPQPGSFEDFYSFNAEESMPRLLPNPSCDQEVPSQMNWGELERALDSPGIGGVDPTAGFFETGGAFDPLQDMFISGIGGVENTAPFFETGGALDPLQDMFTYHRRMDMGHNWRQ